MRVWAGSGRQIVARDMVGRFWPPGCGSGFGRQRCYPNHVFAALGRSDEGALWAVRVCADEMVQLGNLVAVPGLHWPT